MQRLDIGRAFIYAFEDPEWISKMLIGALIFLVSLVFSVVLIGIIPGLLLEGYIVAIARQVRSGVDVPLPRWEDFGILLADGFRVVLAQFIWSIPLIILMFPPFLVIIFSSDNDVSLLATLIMLLCGSLALVYSLFLILIIPLIYLMVAIDERLWAGLNIGRMWSYLRAYPAEVIIVAIMIIVAQAAAGLIGTILCFIGVFVTYIWYLWVTGHLIGQLARQIPFASTESVEVTV